MGERLSVGITGCGDIAAYVATLARINRGVELAACCDVSEERARRFGERFGIRRVYTDYQHMLAEAGLRAVYLGVPHHLHEPMIRAAIAAGLAVFTEKPITRTYAEGLAIARLAAETGAKIAVNYQNRYDSGCYALARAVQSGALGAVRYARINVPWRREPDYFSKAPWHRSLAQAGGGTLITQGSHSLDIVLWACGQPAVQASGVTARRVFEDIEVEDLAMGILTLADGTLVEICSSMAAAVEQPLRIEVYGARGTAIYTDRPIPRTQFVGLRVKQEKPPVPGLHALQRSIEAFRRWVIGGQPHLVTAADALPVLAAVEAIYRSAASGRSEPVEQPDLSLSK